MRKNLPVTDREYSYTDDCNILSTTEPSSKITYVNSDFIRISGFAADELVGKAHNVVRHPDMPAAAFEGLWNSLKQGRSWMGLVKNRRKNGDHYWVDAFVLPIKHDGVATEFQSVRTNPRREHVERAEALYQAAAQGKPVRNLTARWQSKPMLLGLAGIWMLLLIAAAVTWSPVGVFGVAIVLPVLVLSILWRGLSLVDLARGIIDDSLALHVYTTGRSVWDYIRLAFKYLESETYAVVGRMKDGAQQLQGMVAGLSASLLSNARTLETINSELHQSASAVEELAASVRSISTIMGDVAGLVESAATNSDNASHSVDCARDLTDSAYKSVMETHEAIDALVRDSVKVAGILDVISAISEQTNLLALNAAIEAARAGDVGRGFAVVADEIRQLANRTKESTEQIAELVRVTQMRAETAAAAIAIARKDAESSSRESLVASQAFQQVDQQLQQIAHSATESAAAVEQQSIAVDQFSATLHVIRDASEALCGESKNCEQVMAGLEAYVGSMNELATQFWSRQRRF